MNCEEWTNHLQKYDTIEKIELPESSNKYCVIMEFRMDRKLIQVIHNFMSLLSSKGWGLVVYHGTKNEEFLKANLAGTIKHIKYCKMPFENIDASMYSEFFVSAGFWNSLLSIGCEHALIFQMDTVLLRPDIDQFLIYDYVGAPWFRPWRVVANNMTAFIQIGNGGLSLRRVKTMLQIIHTHPRNLRLSPLLENEDIYFSFWLSVEQGYNLPSIEIASEFSVETVWHPNPCGMHQPHLDKMPSIEDFKKLFTK